ncbi:2-C-methyl-D-erythritol 2,4-cyclodiphosphate synthase [Nocardiopsis changdeensis]|uniref:Uncharacterized protein n=1 Tax=Nocardiopsis changdeensis TaxID=2831969 RepID=A0ABX8BV12_9ACTN|nr:MULTISPECIES: 2-C-methyl-D-erythritol 2,4-cyclodiphosphate synthase [Nocardiopsis]QUX25049.1 hypothetical protein KGD84_12755 [Nocardiopsis changdeensis]QYX35435.1 2-C-methyl-D-erythritol 2,4-cyclodiphosphate synthase [Nocardiopsis sp. MT53]
MTDRTEAALSAAAPSADVEHLAAVLRRRREELAGAAGVRIGRGEVVHRLEAHMWAGVEIPAVGCHAATDPLRLVASNGPITCRRCLGRGRQAQEQVLGQIELL